MCLQGSKMSSSSHSLLSSTRRTETIEQVKELHDSIRSAELTCSWRRGCPCNRMRGCMWNLRPSPLILVADNSILREEHFCVHALRIATDLLEGDILTKQHPTLIVHHVPACQILVLCNFSISWILK